MSISVKCEACGKTLKAPDTAAGKKAKCPGCGETVKIPNVEVIYDAEVSEDDEVENDPFGGIDSYDSPAVEPGERRKPCPACGEMILSNAAKCRYCGEIFDSKLKRSGGKRGKSSSRGRASYPLAGPLQRLTGALADGLATVVILAPGFGLMVAGGGLNDNAGEEMNSVALMGVGLLLLGVLVLLILQIYLLATRSQSIGKYLVKTQILDYKTGDPASFVQTFLLRGVVNNMIGGVPCVGPIYSLIDPLFVFSEEHRCLHDQIAGTCVVDIS
jgi:uncharacterized RDD family membrane protein YckC/predicted RNA-binding Zn-ribbon protein involved in translation (DUF1610 family)